MNPTEKTKQILKSAQFRALVTKQRAFSVIMTILILNVYFGFILTIAFDKATLAQKIGKNLTIGLPIGLGIIFFAWLMTGIYVYWANNTYDNSVAEIKKQLD